MEFRERARSARQHAGLRQIDAAIRIGVALSTITGWESGRRKRPDSDTAERAAGVYGVSLDWLLTGNGHGPSARQDATGGPQSPKEATNAE